MRVCLHISSYSTSACERRTHMYTRIYVHIYLYGIVEGSLYVALQGTQQRVCILYCVCVYGRVYVLQAR